MKELTTFRKYLNEGRLLKEGIPQESEIADYVTSMYDDSVEEREGFQSDVWTKEEYTSPTRSGGSIFIALMKHLKSVGGKDALEGNPDIHLELLSNGDIKWSADVTLNEQKEEELELDADYDKGGKYYSEDGAEAFNIQPFKMNDVKYTEHEANRMGKYIVGLEGEELKKFISDYMGAFEAGKGDTEPGRSFKENIDMSNNDGYKAFVDNEDILGKYSIKDAEEMAKELAMTHFDYDDPKQGRFIKDFMDAYKEGGYMDDYIKEVDTHSEDEDVASNFKEGKMTKKALKEKIKAEILSTLKEADEDEIEDEIEDVDVDIDVDAPAETSSEPGLTSEEMEIQNSLKKAYDTAVSIGDEKLSNQIANTITFFTKTHIVPRD